MTLTPLLICGLYAAAFGLLATVLTVRVIIKRVRFRIDSGTGGNPVLSRTIRAHANFSEHVPLALLLMAFAANTGTSAAVVHGLGLTLLVGRLAHAWALSRSFAPTVGRQVGSGLTVLVMAAASALIAYGALIRQ